MSMTRQEWIDRFLASLATVLGALSEASAAAGPATEPPTDGWIVTLQGDHGADGLLVVEFDRTSIEALTKRIVGMETEPPAEVVIDTLKELCAQAAGAMTMEDPLVGTKLAVASVELAGTSAPPTAVLAEIAVGDFVRLSLGLWGDIRLVAPGSPDRARPPVATTPKLDAILDIDLPLVVRFGRTEMALRLVAALGPGSVIDLGRSPDDPVDVLVSDQVVARGEVVTVGGNYGVRITDVMSPADRVRSVEGEI
jgi:flagellar motor switch protein FliN/FliY